MKRMVESITFMIEMNKNAFESLYEAFWEVIVLQIMVITPKHDFCRYWLILIKTPSATPN